MKSLLTIVGILLIPSLCYAETLYLDCLVTGSYSSSTEDSRLSQTKVTIEVKTFKSHKSIDIQAPSNYAISVSSLKRDGFKSVDYSTNENFYLYSTTTAEPIQTNLIKINRLSGQMSAEKTYLGRTLISSNLDGNCERLKTKKF